MTQQPSSYRAAGVDIDAKYRAVQDAREAIRSTYTEGVVGDVGLFGGLFDPARAGAEGQLLVASTDGVGTKVKVAQAAGMLRGVGHDLVNHCVGDILVQGARPLFFLDYIAVDRMVPEAVTEVILGLAEACRANGCALLGGETAEMPGVYRTGEMDIAGTIVGCVQRERLLDGAQIAAGDVAIALPSSGLHTNGYSLARKALFEDAGFELDARPAGRPPSSSSPPGACPRDPVGPPGGAALACGAHSCTNRTASCSSGSATTTAPPTTSECPPRYLVVE